MKYDLAQLYLPEFSRQNLLDLLKKNKSLKDYRYPMVRLDGKVIDIISNIIGEFDKKGELVKLKGFLLDDTERKQTEDRLRILSRAVEQSPVSIFITDKTGCIEYVNPKFVEISGYSFNEVKGRKTRFNEVGKNRYRNLPGALGNDNCRRGLAWRIAEQEKRRFLVLEIYFHLPDYGYFRIYYSFCCR